MLRKIFGLLLLGLALLAPGAASADQMIWSGAVSSSGRQLSGPVLARGQGYYLVVRGNVVFGRWSRNGRTLLQDACYEYNAKGYPDSLPVFKNSENISVCSSYNPNHEYRSAPFGGSGRRIQFWIFDTDYRDNSGSLRVEVWVPGNSGGGSGRDYSQAVALLNASNADFVASLYRSVLHREPDRAGLNGWVNWLQRGKSRAWVTREFFVSNEYQGARHNDRQFVLDLYQGCLGRQPDPGGYRHWLDLLARGKSRISCLDYFLSCPERRNVAKIR